MTHSAAADTHSPQPAIDVSGIQLAQYRFTLETLEPLHLQPFKGSALRGGLGHTLKWLVCIQPNNCDKTCQLGNACPYGYIFETAPPKNAEALRNISNIPRPFVIEPPDSRRMLYRPGEQLSFKLTLIGQGIDYLPYFIAVFRELGQAGLGHRRSKFCLIAINAASPYSRQTQTVYQATDQLVQTNTLAITPKDIEARAALCPTDRLTLNFLSPTKLVHKGRMIKEPPSFQAIIRSLLGRFSSLCYFHCQQRLELDFRAIIDQAAEISLADSEVQWQDWSRFSGRQKQRIEMGGLVGRVTYAGNLGPYLPLLAVGELIHVGKGTVFGNGQYRIEGVS